MTSEAGSCGVVNQDIIIPEHLTSVTRKNREPRKRAAKGFCFSKLQPLFIKQK
jgi:hypothetical protein